MVQNINEIRATQILIWSIGSTLFAHMMSFMSVSYFDSMKYFYYLVIALIVATKYSEINIKNVLNYSENENNAGYE